MTADRRPKVQAGATRRARSGRPSTRRPRSGGGRPWGVLLWVLILVAGGALAGWFLLGRGGSDPVGEAQETDLTAAVPLTGDRAVRVVFPEWDGAGYIIEQRRISSAGRADADLLAIMASLCDGPTTSGAISALPEGTRALAAFMDPEDQSAVLDFSSELVTGHPGGSMACAATLTSILRTVGLNFPGTRSCTILVDGAPVGTLAGHLDLSHPFDPRRWL